MGKRKKVIISSAIALILLTVLNVFVLNNNKKDYMEILTLTKDVLKGEKISQDDLTLIQVKKDKYINEFKLETDKNKIVGLIAAKDLQRGQMVDYSLVTADQDVLESYSNYKYTSIPITKSSYSTAFKIKKGDSITIYFTAKADDVDKILKNKEKIYSSNTIDGFVTCKIIPETKVVSIHNSIGKEVEDNTITDVVVRLEEQDVMLISNLKSQGIFDIVLN